jgi:tRNA(Ile)-lysidine synthase
MNNEPSTINNLNWTNFHSRLHQTLKDKQLLAKGSNILIAVSGGQDSLCLAQLMLDLQPKWGWNLGIAHCDHGWIADVGLADHVAKIVENWSIPFYLETSKTKLPETEDSARKWRYQALISIAQTHNFNYIVTGHSMSDRAETLIYNLVRGAGSDGLSALNWERKLTETIKLVRPLLNFTRRETLEFCQQFKLPIWEDIYNQNKKYARNRIRKDLIPYLQREFNPQVELKLAQTAELLRADVEYLESTASQILQQIISEDKLSINRQILKEHSLSLQRRVIRQFLEKNLAKHPNFEQIESVIKLINAPNKTKTSTLTDNIVLEVENNLIVMQTLSHD